MPIAFPGGGLFRCGGRRCGDGGFDGVLGGDGGMAGHVRGCRSVAGGAGGLAGWDVVGFTSGGVCGESGSAGLAAGKGAAGPGSGDFDGPPRPIILGPVLLEERKHMLRAVCGPEGKGTLVLLVEMVGGFKVHSRSKSTVRESHSTELPVHQPHRAVRSTASSVAHQV